MIPSGNKSMKQQEKFQKIQGGQTDQKLSHLLLHEYSPQNLHSNPMDFYLEGYLKKNHPDVFQPQAFMGSNLDEINERCHVPFDDSKNMFMMEGYDYQPYLSMGHPWYMNGNNFTELVKQQEHDEPKFWQREVKDEFSHDFHQQDFQPIDIKQEHNYEINHRIINEDVNKFLGFFQPSNREQKNRYRRMKVEAFLKKKKQRSFQKKIIYKCRKEVADNRVRYKGRFISLKQAKIILNLDPEQQYEAVFLKEMIENNGKPAAKLISEIKEITIKQEQKQESH